MSKTALQQFNELEGNEEPNPLERLRFFCSLAMNGDDWLDSEKFFDDITQSSWQPINTAPKDRRILLAYEDKGPVTGYYDRRNKSYVPDSWCGRFTNAIRRSQPIAWQELPEFNGEVSGK